MKLKLYNQIDRELNKIDKAMQHLEKIGAVKCPIKECGDVGCASTVVFNAITDARVKIFKLMGGKVEKVKK